MSKEDRIKDIYNLRNIDFILMQTMYDVIPKEVWVFHTESGTDPFELMSKETARRIKRKFRKLKRKANVSKDFTASKMWSNINRYLERKII